MKPVRVMVFYDGQYFKAGNVFFRYKARKGWVSLPAFHELLERFVTARTGAEDHRAKVVGAHYFDGRASSKVAAAGQLEKERDFEMSLVAAGIVPHYLPVVETLRGLGHTGEAEYELSQKGVDVAFALDVLDLAHVDRFDVAVLVTGDGDFLSLVRKLTSLGKQVAVVGFEIDEWVDVAGSRHRGTSMSRSLGRAATWQLDLIRIAGDPEWAADVTSLFFKPKGDDSD